MTYRVTSEWVGLKRQLPYPSIDFLHPTTFSVDWDQCVLIRLLDDHSFPRDDSLEFEFVGKSLRKDAPSLGAGACLGEIPGDSLLSLSSPLLPKLFERQTAVIYSGCLPWQNANAIYFRAIAVPFGDSQGALKYGLGALSHKMTNETLSPADVKTEFLEFCDGGWSPFGDTDNRQLSSVA